MDENDYSIQNLCEKSGLPRRTIHYYTQRGILPPPDGAGLGARYNLHHLLRLRLIPFLRRQGLQLDQIREKFQNTDLADLQILHDRFTKIEESSSVHAEPQLYHHYSLPSGLFLLVPAEKVAAYQQQLEDLLEAANKIFS